MPGTYFQEKDGCIFLNLRVVPRASRDEIQGVLGDELKVRIQAPPVEGKANERLIRFLSKQWDVPRANIEILSGDAGRSKRIRIVHPPAGLSDRLRELE